ncbi:MAG: DNA primase [Bacteroidales bacterium]|nr:DNA primase [Bacteroidales bacterium]
MIKQETINEILNTSRIEEVVGDFVRLTKRGVNYIGLCPFHDEKTPSFTVSPAKGICKCFGCGVGGDSIGFIMKHENYSYVEALRYLAKKYNIEIQETQLSSEEIQLLNEREALLLLTTFASDYFAENLHKHEEGIAIGLSYLKERGFTENSIKKFHLGYAVRQRDAFLTYATTKGYTIDNLEKSGLIIVRQQENNISRFDRFTERVIFPIHNFSGKVIGFGGRTLSTLNKNIAKYINSPESAIYHKSDILYGIFQAKRAIQKADKCYLVEGYTDVISLYQAGIENVVSSSGTSLTQGQIRQITRLTNNITVLYDGDSAGIQAAIRAVGMLLKENLNIRIVILPPSEDPDSFVRKRDLQEIQDFFAENEKDFIHFKIDVLSKEAGNDPIKKAEFVKQIATDIASIPDIIKVSFFVKQCSTLLGIPEPVLYQSVNKIRLATYRKEKLEQTKENTDINLLPADTEKFKLTSNSLEPLSISEVEKHILFLLLNYGEQIIEILDDTTCVPIRVDQFIFNDLDKDGIEFETLLYQKFLTIYAETAEKYSSDIIPQLKQNLDQEMFELFVTLVDIKPSPSPLWESSRIKSFINTIDNNKTKLHNEILNSLQVLRLLKLRAIKNTYLNETRKANEEDSLLILKKLNDITKIICDIEKDLGVSYR